MTPELTVQEQYIAEIGKLPNNKKNDLVWLQAKLDEFRSWKSVDSTPDDDWNATPEEWMITKPVTPEPLSDPKDVPEPEVKKDTVPKDTGQTPKKHRSLIEIQAFYGITNEELYSDNVLVKKYHLSDEEIQTIRAYTEKSESDIDLNLNYHEMPDYIQVIFNKYGFNWEILKSEKKIREIITANTKETPEEQEKEIHQLIEFYKKLRSEALSQDLIVENPNLQNPAV